MSRLEELLSEYAPGGVAFATLGEVGEFIRGTGLQKSDLTDDGMPAIHYGQIHTHYGLWASETKSFVSPALGDKLRRAHPGDLVIATTSEDDAAVAKATAWLGKEEVAVSGDAYIYRHSLNPRYAAYFFQSAQFQMQKERRITGTKVRRVSGDALSSVRVPVPPAEVQDEIVRILDHFVDLEKDLKAELAARRAQYSFYADSLLEFGSADDVARVPLGELATIVRGASPRPIHSFITAEVGGVPWIKIGDVAAGGKYITKTGQCVTSAGASKSRRVYPGDFVLSNSMSFGRPYISRIEGCIHDGWLAISNFGSSFIPDFLYHLLRSVPVQADFARRASNGTVQNLNVDIVKSVPVPVPSIEEQTRIAVILDQFDVLVNDPEVGIPAELAARRAQYEHYRDRLLTFEEVAA